MLLKTTSRKKEENMKNLNPKKEREGKDKNFKKLHMETFWRKIKKRERETQTQKSKKEK